MRKEWELRLRQQLREEERTMAQERLLELKGKQGDLAYGDRRQDSITTMLELVKRFHEKEEIESQEDGN